MSEVAKEYIERNALIAEYDRVHIGPAGGARKLMVDAPTADVVEVVRCKDCIHWWSPMEDDFHYCRLKKGLGGLVVKEDYCSFATPHTKRKE